MITVLLSLTPTPHYPPTPQQPYSECENRVGDIYQNVTNHVPPESLATVDLATARAFIELCLEPEPAERPSARELLEHKFLRVRGWSRTVCGWRG